MIKKNKRKVNCASEVPGRKKIYINVTLHGDDPFCLDFKNGVLDCNKIRKKEKEI